LIERSFADASNLHGFKPVRWRGLIKQSIQDSSWELLNLAEKDKALQAELHRQRAKPKKQQQEVAYER
jgi:hypothetical protein